MRDLLWNQPVRERSAGPVVCRPPAQGGLQDREWVKRSPFLVDGIAMDRLPTRDIDSTCSGESSLRTARISRRTSGPSLGARGEGGQ